ncbi:response regulator [Candidatus Finniella inopinata]|uniref:Response regulator n=1 Tax=Candidatus Finniella inopinata TaxID=1696036 RepID=A0A4Q7DI52_9PROT|nr:response regulator [Candidatus Finniella inopinata]RZI45755.1 response regulator [Candidatus Finniella inopinata]
MSHTSSPSKKEFRILLVEDMLGMGRMGEKFVQTLNDQEDYQITLDSVKNGKDAVDFYKKSISTSLFCCLSELQVPYDLIVMDIEIPNTYESCRVDIYGGIKAAQKIRDMGYKGAMCAVTCCVDYNLESLKIIYSHLFTNWGGKIGSCEELEHMLLKSGARFSSSDYHKSCVGIKRLHKNPSGHCQMPHPKERCTIIPLPPHLGRFELVLVEKSSPDQGPSTDTQSSSRMILTPRFVPSPRVFPSITGDDIVSSRQAVSSQNLSLPGQTFSNNLEASPREISMFGLSSSPRVFSSNVEENLASARHAGSSENLSPSGQIVPGSLKVSPRHISTKPFFDSAPCLFPKGIESPVSGRRPAASDYLRPPGPMLSINVQNSPRRVGTPRLEANQ